LTESVARKIFKDEDPLGKALTIRGRYDLTVSGVMSDLPKNSHLQINALVSFDIYEKSAPTYILDNPWAWDGFLTYLLLKDQADAASVQAKTDDLITKDFGDWLKEKDQQLDLTLQPVTSIHLHSNLLNEVVENGNHKLIRYLTIASIFILLLTWINYHAIMITRSIERRKEIAVRKIAGGRNTQVFAQFFFESIALNTIMVVLAWLSALLLLPAFNDFTGGNLDLPAFIDYTLGYPILTTTLGAIVIGAGAAFMLSRLKPIQILNGRLPGPVVEGFARNVLLIIQFAITGCFLVATVVMKLQNNFLSDYKLGFQKDQVLTFRNSELYDSTFVRRTNSLRSQITPRPWVKSVTTSSEIPGEAIQLYANSVRKISADPSTADQYYYMRTDERFVDVYGLNLLEGRNFSALDQERKKLTIVNELAAKNLGFETYADAINQKITFKGDTIMIVGVVKNYHHISPKKPIFPLLIIFDPDGAKFFSILLETEKPEQAIDEARGLFSTVNPGQPFLHTFLDERYSRQNTNDIHAEKILSLFLSLSIVLTLLGLVGFIHFVVSKSVKEIAIRKIHGASLYELLFALLKRPVLLWGASLLISIPASVYFMKTWLEEFENRIPLNWWMLALPNAAVLLIILAICTAISLKAAVVNPTKSLRSE
jgi:putative ABC transport system permease protein